MKMPKKQSTSKPNSKPNKDQNEMDDDGNDMHYTNKYEEDEDDFDGPLDDLNSYDNEDYDDEDFDDDRY